MLAISKSFKLSHYACSVDFFNKSDRIFALFLFRMETIEYLRDLCFHLTKILY